MLALSREGLRAVRSRALGAWMGERAGRLGSASTGRPSSPLNASCLGSAQPTDSSWNVIAGAFVDRCRRVSVLDDRHPTPAPIRTVAPAGGRPWCRTCVTAATGGSAPSNRRADRLGSTSSSLGLEPPDRKSFTRDVPSNTIGFAYPRFRPPGPSPVAPSCSDPCASATGRSPTAVPARSRSSSSSPSHS